MIKFVAWDRLEKGRISSVYYDLKELPKAKVNIYVTDGYCTKLIGQHPKESLNQFGNLLLGQLIDTTKVILKGAINE